MVEEEEHADDGCRAVRPAVYAALTVGGAVSVLAWNWMDRPSFTPGADISPFAPLYVFAQAIERLMEPFAASIGGDKETAAETLYGSLKSGDLTKAAKDQTNVDRIRRNRGVITWAIASVLGMLAAATCGVLLLGAIGLKVAGWIDVVATGIAIGSGTKPLHDLIANIQKSKEAKEDPPERVAA